MKARIRMEVVCDGIELGFDGDDCDQIIWKHMGGRPEHMDQRQIAFVRGTAIGIAVGMDWKQYGNGDNEKQFCPGCAPKYDHYLEAKKKGIL